MIGGGGILPDVLVEDSLAAPVQAVLRRSLETRWVRSWLDAHGAAFRADYPTAEAFRARSRLSDADYARFAEGRHPKKVIVVPGRLVNVVV